MVNSSSFCALSYICFFIGGLRSRPQKALFKNNLQEEGSGLGWPEVSVGLVFEMAWVVVTDTSVYWWHKWKSVGEDDLWLYSTLYDLDDKESSLIVASMRQATQAIYGAALSPTSLHV